MPPERNVRFANLIPSRRLKKSVGVVIGCGAVGYNLARQLVIQGYGNVILVDFDKVETANLGAQGWPEDALGDLKVTAAERELERLNGEVSVHTIDHAFDTDAMDEVGAVLTEDDKELREPVFFLCVDSMSARKEIVELITSNPLLESPLIIEARMGAEAFFLHVLDSKEDVKKWIEGWYPDSEVQSDACTTQTTFYCATCVAGLMACVHSQIVQGFNPPFEVAGLLKAPSVGIVREVETKEEDVKDTPLEPDQKKEEESKETPEAVDSRGSVSLAA